MGMLEDNKHDFRMVTLKAIAELAKYGVFPIRTACLYIQTFADDFRDLLCEYTFVMPMVGIMQLFYYKEQSMLLHAVGELAKYGIQFHNSSY